MWRKKHNIYHSIILRKKQGLKSFAVLIDPDKTDKSSLSNIITQSITNAVDFFFVGGSLLDKDNLREVVVALKSSSDIPVVLFPSTASQVVEEADAVLFLSLISGRNADYLISQQVIAAPILAQMDIEILPTGYMLVDCGAQTTASYISNTMPIPYNKPEIAIATALAGEMLGMKLLYLDGGSGAEKHINSGMISSVVQNTEIPVIVGGGITQAKEAELLWKSGADLLVVGNKIEQTPHFIAEVCSMKENLNLIKN
jgi:phosphoglycerol geranylgeranyltransferase